jgi:ComEC/Rec2-related protein
MSDLQIALTTVAAAIAALLAPGIPRWAVIVVIAAAVVVRHRHLVAVALVAVVAARAGTALAALDQRPDGPVVASEAAVLTDAVQQFGRWQFEVDRAGGHEAADLASTEPEPVVGERLVVSGATSPIADSGWRRARHLRGRLRIDEVRRRSPPGLPMRAANATRDALLSGAASLGDARPLFAGLVLGDDRDQDAVTRHRFRASGLAHLLAVSGQNVAFVLVAASPVIGAGSLRWRWVATVAVLAGFTLVTRWEPSVLRAVAMAAVAATAHLQGRYASGTRRVAVAVLVLLVVDPLLVWSAGFRLSVAATAALVALQRPIARRLPGPRWVAVPLATVLAAQIGTMPLLATMGASVTVASIPANLLAVPVAGWVMVWGLTGGAVAALVGGPIATVLHRPTALLLAWVDGVARVASSPRLPGAGVMVVVTIVGSAVVAAAATARWWRRVGACGVMVGTVLGLLPAGQVSSAGVPGLRIVRSPSGVVVLVAGGQVDGLRMLDELTRLRVERVDLAVFTSDSGATTDLAASLREVVPTGTVVAPAGRVRDADQLSVGRLAAGSMEVEVRHEGGRWGAEVARVG